MSLLIIACGALVREIAAVADQLPDYDLRCVPATLHNRPEKIVPAIEQILDETTGRYDQTVLAFGDCGTGGALDQLCTRRRLTRLPGAHCYAFFAGPPDFDALMKAEPGTFFLTDFLARQFETLVIKPLGLDRYPALRDDYFGHYSHVVYLSQGSDEALIMKAKTAAQRLGLTFEHRPTGLKPFGSALSKLAA